MIHGWPRILLRRPRGTERIVPAVAAIRSARRAVTYFIRAVADSSVSTTHSAQMTNPKIAMATMDHTG